MSSVVFCPIHIEAVYTVQDLDPVSLISGIVVPILSGKESPLKKIKNIFEIIRKLTSRYLQNISHAR